MERLSIHNSEALILTILRLNCEVSPAFLVGEKKVVYLEKKKKIVMLCSIPHLNREF